MRNGAATFCAIDWKNPGCGAVVLTGPEPKKSDAETGAVCGVRDCCGVAGADVLTGPEPKNEAAETGADDGMTLGVVVV